MGGTSKSKDGDNDRECFLHDSGNFRLSEFLEQKLGFLYRIKNPENVFTLDKNIIL